jgi:hypothetical protein
VPPHPATRAAQVEFLDPRMLPLEIEEYLLLTACDFSEKRNRQNPGGNIPLRDCIYVLRTEARKHHLPISHPEIWDRVVRTAQVRLQKWNLLKVGNAVVAAAKPKAGMI